MLTHIKRATTLLALFASSLTFAASTASGHETISPGIGQGVQPEAQESKPAKRKKAQPQNADQPAETAAPAPEAEAQTAATKPDKPRRQKPPKVSRRSPEPVATPSPSPPVELSTMPSPEPTVVATAPAASAMPSLTALSSTASKPASDNSILSLPVVLGLFALTLIALIVTVLMLMKQLRGTSRTGV